MSGEVELNEAGNVKISPLLDYETHLIPGVAVILRIGYAEDMEGMQSHTTEHLQLTLTPGQCRSLAETLLRAKSQVEAQSSVAAQAGAANPYQN
jgi:hypothetical protein